MVKNLSILQLACLPNVAQKLLSLLHFSPAFELQCPESCILASCCSSYGSESADYLRRARALRGMHYRQPVEVSSNTVVYNCHRGRVKVPPLLKSLINLTLQPEWMNSPDPSCSDKPDLQHLHWLQCNL